MKSALKFLGFFLLAALPLMLGQANAQSINKARTNGFDDQITSRILTLNETLFSIPVDAAYSVDEAFIAARLLPQSEKVTRQRQILSDLIFQRHNGDPEKYFEIYKSTAAESGSDRDFQIAQMYEAYWRVKSFGPDSEEGKAFLTYLEGFETHEDWFLVHRSKLLKSMFFGKVFDINAALEAANEAGNIIPEVVNSLTIEASFELNSIANPIYFMLGDARLGISAVEDFIAQGQRQDRYIDVSTLYNNLIFVTSRWREHPLMEEISRAALNRAKLSGETSDQVMAATRLSQALNYQSKFEEAERVTVDALTIADQPAWELGLQYQRAIALAGQSKISEARAAKQRIETLIISNPRFGEVNASKENQFQALMAVAENRPRDAYNFMMKNAIYEMQWQLQNSDRNTQNLLSSVERDREVQLAKQKEAEAEALNQRLRAEARTRQLWIAIGVAVFAFIIAACLAAFAFYNSRVNTQLKISNDRALAGERAKTEFLAVMSHELRTPLNGIIGLSDVLSRDGPDADTRFKSSVVLKSGLTLLDLLTNVLDMAKMESDQLTVTPEPTDLPEIMTALRELWSARARRKGIAYTVFVADNIPHRLHLDGMRMRQCIENLISNAIKFTETGRVHVHVTGTPRENEVGGFDLTIIVADTGKGMTANQLEDIFNPFTQADTTITRRYGGSGLGLAITRSLARLMGGDVNVISREGRGSEFTMTIPSRICEDQFAEPELPNLVPSAKEQLERLDQEHAGAPRLTTVNGAPLDNIDQNIADALSGLIDEIPLDTADEIEPESLEVHKVPAPTNLRHSADIFRGLRVLLAEDIVTNQDVVRIFLEPLGVEVSCAENGQAALDMLDKANYDLILMDVRMPVMNGVEATAAIRQRNDEASTLPIIALTADSSAENNAKCMAAGANLFLTKPVVASELFGSIRFVLKQAENQRLRRPA